MPTFAAVDLGAQSGRVAVGRFDGERLSVEEVHRFSNVPVRVRGTLHWDVLQLYGDVLDPQTFEVDAVATERVRAARRSGKGGAADAKSA